ncbi:hypothetical protein BB561_001466 [Smittium simulii]|uniref:Uncharacterized protein n=1 Tax=Smittium simulii TaxID=133385 RepID=A0A2T9YUI7_9FUNG|nr:hypothetical protein BB561_001466 [Smittium simulii]
MYLRLALQFAIMFLLIGVVCAHIPMGSINIPEHLSRVRESIKRNPWRVPRSGVRQKSSHVDYVEPPCVPVGALIMQRDVHIVEIISISTGVDVHMNGEDKLICIGTKAWESRRP